MPKECHHLLLLFQVPINALIADLSGFHLTKSQPPEQDFTGILWALAVPVLSATINIITRQVENNSTESFLVDLSMYIIHQAKHVHYSVFVFWFALSGLVVSISGLSWDMHDPFQVLFCLSQVRVAGFEAKLTPVKVPIIPH